MQLFQRTYNYIYEYQRLVYDFYSKTHVAFLVDYYNLDTTSTIWDMDLLAGGSYEKIGDLSGVRWNKYLMLPVYFPEEVMTALDAQDIGYIKENETHIVIPSSYGIVPSTRDLLKLDQTYLRQSNNTYPIFSVTGLEKTSNTDIYFWKLKIEIEQSKTTEDLEDQIKDSYVYFDYDKKIHTLSDSISLTKLLNKSSTLSDNIKEKFDDNSGLYFI